ncbi:MAG: MaoC family dehydratase N-terminal domain-containing protein [Sphingomonadaceae bacterium]
MDWTDWIGREQVQHDMLTPALLARFRATFDSSETGDIAPQGIHWCLCTPEAATHALDSDGHPRRGGFLPPIPLPRRMWASSTLSFHAPIAVGAAIARRSVIAGVQKKIGGSGPLVFVQLDHETTADGALVVREQQTLVYREASTAAPAPLGSGAPALADHAWHREVTPSAPLLFRYSALTFNSHRIHYDAPYAIAEEGYRGIVVHGPLTATLLLDLAARELSANRLANFSFRGVSPAIAGEVLHLVGTVVDTLVTLTALGSDGREIMTATAEIAR